jgi:internalin A
MKKKKEKDDLQEAFHRIEEAKRTRTTQLSLAHLNLTAIPDSLTELSHLQHLSLNGNQIDSIPDSIAELSALQSLDLSGNEIKSIPDSIFRLSQLRTLDLSGNAIRSIPDSIAKLSQLQMLDLSLNWCTTFPNAIAELVNLEHLELAGLGLQDIPSFIVHLSHLQTLIMYGNRLTSIPEWLFQLRELRILNLGLNGAKGSFSFTEFTVSNSNKITLIPDAIAQLSHLQHLNLSGNQIRAIPDSVADLADLEYLDVRQNRLNMVTHRLADLQNLKVLLLHENPDLGIPKEIFGPTAHDVFMGRVHKPPQEILTYLRQVVDSRPLNEAKLILVGHGAVGKTSLVKSLSTGKFKKGEKTTEGIKISDWECQLDKKNKAIVHIWDFGGQEMMHATHQFFLTQRSLYLLVLNRRQGGADREADYWFRLIRAFGGKDAPVIVVLNKQKSEPFDVNREGWLEKYKGNIKGFVATDCEDKKSLTLLKREIIKELRAMESLQSRFPRRWFAIKDELSQMSAEHISFEQYRELCQELGESDAASQTSLAGFLHDLGIALNYGQDPRLRFNYVLKPEWVTQGIYALLHAFVSSKGIFTHTEAEKILAKQKYSTEDTNFILGLMEKFELSFPLDEKPQRILIPELLDDQQPKEAASFKPPECLNFGYKYPVLTEGLLPRFIARTHHLGRKETRWKSGVILEDSVSGCKALVKADSADTVVRVHIDGPRENRRELLGIIRYNFDVIHAAYEFIPEPLVYPPAAPQKALLVNELEALGRSKATVSVVLPDRSVVDQNIAALIDPVLSTPPPLKLFLSYSHHDESSIDELRKDLKVMERNGLIRPWYDRALTAGEKWEPTILNELNAADIVVCQISRNYLASDACMTELNAAIERNRDGEATVVAYVLNDCGWREEKRLREFQLLPTDGMPLSDWKDANKYWRAVAEGIQKAVKKFQVEKKSRPRRLEMKN